MMKTVIKWLKEARSEIIGGLVVAFVLWLLGQFHFGTTNDAALRGVGETKPQEVSQRIESPQSQPEQEKVRKKLPAMSDYDFVELCKSGNVSKVREAIMDGANVNAAKADDGMTALTWAASNGNTEVVRLLLEHGADVNANGWTALMSAAKMGQTEVAALLLKHGADVNAKDNVGDTALSAAAHNGHTEMAELLLKHGADVNAKNNNGDTALMWAASGGYAEVAELLLKHGANVNAKDNNGYTALDWATSEGHNETADLLRRYGAKE